MSELITCEHHQGVAHIGLNRPEKLNALSAEMLTQLLDTLLELDADKLTRAVVISGSSRAFAAGADTGTLATASAIALYTSGFSEKWDSIAAINKPIIAALSGYALGGGLELALLCDIVIADETAIFGLPETHIGIIPGAGGTQRLVKAVGKSLAMEMILAGRKLNADEALSFGLISRMTSPEQLIEQALKIAQNICRASPLANLMAKRAVLASFDMGLTAGVSYERSLSALIAASEDRTEGMRALSAKEQGKFTGD
ncbi:enoyl-CoA hydratase [Rouxiella sp. S1S-2]|uniref:enoyl-CoA hydratase-related protein n=1 Tax=Rouxiella sp. S1S-2 TaxID=2653856 RepID=UPI0012659F1B|nr:enoyl-CoA hydratase-related protein [Rouxiella sp. S1S-2]KAB7896219.1 enoyl-CoA hydratase [Rouxiella sp. S1S-2]